MITQTELTEWETDEAQDNYLGFSIIAEYARKIKFPEFKPPAFDDSKHTIDHVFGQLFDVNKSMPNVLTQALYWSVLEASCIVTKFIFENNKQHACQIEIDDFLNSNQEHIYNELVTDYMKELFAGQAALYDYFYNNQIFYIDHNGLLAQLKSGVLCLNPNVDNETAENKRASFVYIQSCNCRGDLDPARALKAKFIWRLCLDPPSTYLFK